MPIATLRQAVAAMREPRGPPPPVGATRESATKPAAPPSNPTELTSLRACVGEKPKRLSRLSATTPRGLEELVDPREADVERPIVHDVAGDRAEEGPVGEYGAPRRLGVRRAGRPRRLDVAPLLVRDAAVLRRVRGGKEDKDEHPAEAKAGRQPEDAAPAGGRRDQKRAAQEHQDGAGGFARLDDAPRGAALVVRHPHAQQLRHARVAA
mmetsp:Transcript_25480/g.85871  ORF Transcript_25480/g.85871 Transcript_25480/m.85871 type:complete len:209 (+) Transcript_25480:101-727(+)